MADRGCLIIDDIARALETATDLGRALLAGPAEQLRATVRRYAEFRGWPVIRHETFTEWALGQAAMTSRRWLVLDPLLHGSMNDSSFIPFRLTRRHDKGVNRVCASQDNWDNQGLAGLECGILDDAVSSGRTLAHASNLIAEAGGSLREVVVCAGAGAARERLRSFHPGLQWREFFPGDWRVIHLRDGCPHFPYSGRATALPSILDPVGSAIELRIPPTSVEGNLWQVLWLDREVRDALLSARLEITRQLAITLGRPARISDLSCLGKHVPALVEPDWSVAADVTLDSLLPFMLQHKQRPPDEATPSSRSNTLGGLGTIGRAAIASQPLER